MPSSAATTLSALSSTTSESQQPSHRRHERKRARSTDDAHLCGDGDQHPDRGDADDGLHRDQSADLSGRTIGARCGEPVVHRRHGFTVGDAAVGDLLIMVTAILLCGLSYAEGCRLCRWCQLICLVSS
jgi:hypothetical protein